MITKFMHKKELEDEIAGKGDFVQIDHLQRFLNLMPPTDMKKFALLKLAEIYDRKEMYKDAAKAYNDISVSSFTFSDKIDYLVLEAKELAKGAHFEDADRAIRRAFTDTNATQKANVIAELKSFYKQQGDLLARTNKTSKAALFYEKLLRMDLKSADKEEIKTALIKIYEKLGKMNEVRLLKGV